VIKITLGVPRTSSKQTEMT